LAREQAENGFSETSSNNIGGNSEKAAVDENEAQLQALFLNQ
jgi:hypothetical protein